MSAADDALRAIMDAIEIDTVAEAPAVHFTPVGLADLAGALADMIEAARAEGEAAGRAAERERVLVLVRAAYDAAREAERQYDILDPSAASGALDVLEQAIEAGEHVGAAGGAA